MITRLLGALYVAELMDVENRDLSVLSDVLEVVFGQSRNHDDSELLFLGSNI